MLAELTTDRTPYTCSGCSRVTWAPPHQVAVTCGHCGTFDLGTALARNRWRTVLEVRQENKPPVLVTLVPAPPAQRWPRLHSLAGHRVSPAAAALAIVAVISLLAVLF